MNYFLQRGTERYGPYPEEAIRGYVQSGHIKPGEVLIPEGGGETILAAALANLSNAFPQPSSERGAISSPSSSASLPQPFHDLPATIPPSVPKIPAVDWWLVLLLSLVTCGLFGYVWTIVQAIWVRKINPGSRALLYLIILSIGFPVFGFVIFRSSLFLGLGDTDAWSLAYFAAVMILGLGFSFFAIATFLSLNTSLREATATWGAARIDLGAPFLAVVIGGWLTNVIFLAAPAWLQYRLDEVRKMRVGGA